MITILCAQDDSNYYKIPDLNIYNKSRNAYTYSGNDIIIAHPPCQQWSKLRWRANENKLEKELAYYCYELVNKNGGILEHPVGSNFFKTVNANTKNIYTVNQTWWNFPAEKRTLLYVHNVKLLPVYNSPGKITRSIQNMDTSQRSKMTLQFCEYLVNCVKNTEQK